MPDLPPIPLITRWREHLKKMVNQHYSVDDIDVRLISYRLYDDNQTARIFFSSRNYDIPYTDMPERMRHWIPVTDHKFMTTYDHISAESGLTPADDSNLQITTSSNTGVIGSQEPTPREVLTSMFIDQMPQDLKDIGKIVEAANNTILNLKDVKSGHNGQAYINQAHAISNLLDKVIKAKKLTIDEFNLALKMANMQAPNDPPNMKRLKEGGKD